MGKNKTGSWMLKVLFAGAFLKFLIEDMGCSLDSGIILVAENDRIAKKYMKQFELMSNVQNIKKLGQKEMPYNYEAGVHLYSRYDNEKLLYDYLRKDEFLPVVVVGGIVPEWLLADAYVFPLQFTENEIEVFTKQLPQFEKYVRENIKNIIKEIKTALTSKQCRLTNVASEYDNFYRFCMTVSNVGFIYEKAFGRSDEEIQEDKENFEDKLLQAIAYMEDAKEPFEVRELLTILLHSYVEEHAEIRVAEFQKSCDLTEGTIGESKTIFVDDNYIYMVDELLRDVCAPLLNTISFTKLKNELYMEAVLVCNDMRNKNFTVKKSVYDVENKLHLRIRFLKLRKDMLDSAEGLSIMDTYELRQFNQSDGAENSEEEKSDV